MKTLPLLRYLTYISMMMKTTLFSFTRNGTRETDVVSTATRKRFDRAVGSTARISIQSNFAPRTLSILFSIKRLWNGTGKIELKSVFHQDAVEVVIFLSLFVSTWEHGSKSSAISLSPGWAVNAGRNLIILTRRYSVAINYEWNTVILCIYLHWTK